ncbi:proton-conducting transporter membrane subunit [Kallotenue papyrolyticum]|uniref:proton-conducting transporter transmembrane domain-containing protein n=1 Tax=Kallotenue papyrolyticum TaxID=1325125 RepID=UPI0004926C34|nr:proton-conducting transporter membrane subunit [Kallotenue papyrolyticum]
MQYIALILFPIAMAGGTFVARRDARLVGWMGVAAIAVQLWLALTLPADLPARVLDVSVGYGALSRLLLVVLCLASLIVACSSVVLPVGEYWISTLLLLLGIAAAMLLLQEPLIVATLLLLASLIGGMELVDQPVGSGMLLRPQTLALALKYLVLVALGGLFLLIGFVLATAYEQQLATSGPALMRLVFGLLLIGTAVRLGLVPFHLWAPDLADEAPPQTIFLHLGLLSVLALPVLLVALQTQPQLVVGNPSGQRLLIGLGALSALGGSLLALLSGSQRRMLALLCVANLGLLVIGLGIGTLVGVSAAVLGALNHVLALALIMTALALLERPVPGRREQAGALRERPIAALALLVGVLALLGVPPMSGFAARLALLAALQEQGWPVIGAVLASLLAMALVAGRWLHLLLLRPPELPSVRGLLSDDLARLTVIEPSYAPLWLRALVLLAGAGVIALGLWPLPVLALVEQLVGSFSFLRQ